MNKISLRTVHRHMLLHAVFLSSFLRVCLIQAPDHLLAGKNVLAACLKCRVFCGQWAMGRCLLRAEMLKRTRRNQEVLMNICTICKKLRKNSFTFFSSSSSHCLHPDSVIFPLEDKLLLASIKRLCIVSLIAMLFASCSITCHSRRKQCIAVTLQLGWASLSVYKVASICIDWIRVSNIFKSLITSCQFASVLGRPALIQPKMKTWMPASVKKWLFRSKHK